MKRLLLVLPLLLTSCRGGKVYTNVYYEFSNKEMCYLVTTTNDKKFKVDPKNYYEIKVKEYKEIASSGEYGTYYTSVYNEYYVTTRELFVYTM